MTSILQVDQDLDVGDIQALADANSVAGFFAALGYDTAGRMTQTPGAMDIRPESLRRKVRHIERVADQEGGAL